MAGSSRLIASRKFLQLRIQPQPGVKPSALLNFSLYRPIWNVYHEHNRTLAVIDDGDGEIVVMVLLRGNYNMKQMVGFNC